MEVQALALDPVGGAAAPERDLRVDEDEHCPVGKQPVRRDQVQLEHLVHSEAAGKSLVGE